MTSDVEEIPPEWRPAPPLVAVPLLVGVLMIVYPGRLVFLLLGLPPHAEPTFAADA